MANALSGKVGRMGIPKQVARKADYLSDATPEQAAVIVVAGILLLGFFLWLADEANTVLGIVSESY